MNSWQACTSKPRLPVLVLNGEITARGTLVLVADKVGYGLVLGLLGGRLVALVALAEELFLNEVDSLVEGVLVGLSLLAAAGKVVELVHEAPAGAAAFAGLLLVTGAVVLGVVAATSEVLDEVHD